VVLWDAARWERLERAPLKVPEGTVSSVAFSPDGKTLVAGYIRQGGGGVRLSPGPGSWVESAQRIANRNLTRAEWKQYFPDRPEYRPTFPDLPVPPEERPPDGPPGGGAAANIRKE
jgi:hypothetical protein